MADASPPRRMAPTVVAIGICQIIGWSATFSLPGVIGPSMAADLDASLNIIMLGPTIMLTILAVASWWIAPVFERFGARTLMIGGAVVLTVGLGILSIAPNVQFYLAAWILFGIGGAASLSTAAQIVLADIFGDRARQAIGVMSLLSGLSNTVMWPILSRLDAASGWRAATGLCAAALVLIYIPLVWKFAAAPHRVPRGDHTPEASEQQRLDPMRFALVAGVTALNGFITWGFSLTLIPLLVQKGIANSQAVTLASLLGIFAISARAIDMFGIWSPLRSAIVSTATMFGSFVLLCVGGSLAVAAIFIILYGLAGGLMAIVRATLPLTMFPPQAYARASAKLALPLNLSFAAAPPVYAWLLENPGASSALVLSIVLTAAAMTCLILLTLLVHRQHGTAAT